MVSSPTVKLHRGWNGGLLPKATQLFQENSRFFGTTQPLPLRVPQELLLSVGGAHLPVPPGCGCRLVLDSGAAPPTPAPPRLWVASLSKLFAQGRNSRAA